VIGGSARPVRCASAIRSQRRIRFEAGRKRASKPVRASTVAMIESSRHDLEPGCADGQRSRRSRREQPARAALAGQSARDAVAGLSGEARSAGATEVLPSVERRQPRRVGGRDADLAEPYGRTRRALLNKPGVLPAAEDRRSALWATAHADERTLPDVCLCIRLHV
jgi:hypothetical protein